ncbi:efflux transporter outer membrane subunit [Herbaspirillum sp. RTI4]|uniref:efflux transporter outer membrane subunit n=1 Tax=Herbaspirillum sp. RTI4 TaxID=3048640 RepID=UPI002AB40268|nr:efflux transporter outer membrane subunit [Herbaspirillum sp. RTI4]MDY7579820.1 efflux transporter outer membrane subunit [Herbaspirillum sp. RTI4]MEA9981907.1 efflux transporter outer membrane subunit [Herbaspirillum sp. RTI4]
MPLALTLGLSLLLSACSVGPDYVRPQTPPLPLAFKEMQDWKPAQPADLKTRGNWWEMFGDAQLNGLIAQIDISNQNLAQSEATFRKALALVQTAQAAYSPTLKLGVGGTRSGTNTQANGPAIGNNYNASLSAAWEADVWGRVRRNVESNEASAQASAGDLAAVRLSAQAQLAQDYLQLRVQDQLQKLLDDTVVAYQRSYTLTQNQYQAGVAAKSDVIQALTQLQTAQASALDNGVLGAQLEHAIAMLVGQPASSFSIAPAPLLLTAPPVPVALPSMLLERRPDVASAERLAAAANAQIGVTKAANYPDLSLSASGGYQSTSFANWFNLPNRIWSLGPQLAQTIFDGGATRALTSQAIASYDASVAVYKQTVLMAFQEVEDNLAALRILEKEAAVQDQALQSARQALALVLNQYKAGTVSYVNVITAQAVALTSERSSLAIFNRRLTASVLLAKALGGGWSVDAMSDLSQVSGAQRPADALPAN